MLLPAVQTMNAYKYDTHALPMCLGADKNLFKVPTSFTVRPAHSTQYIWCFLNINGELLTKWWTPRNVVPMLWGADKNLFQDRPQNCTLFQEYMMMISSKWISIEMLQCGCSNNERLQAWYQCTSWVVRSGQKFVPRPYVVHSQNCTLFQEYMMMSSKLYAIEYQ